MLRGGRSDGTEGTAVARWDYLMLAESARVEPGGSVSLLGGSFSRLMVPSLPVQTSLAVVGRAFMDPGEGPAPVVIRMIGPDDTYRISAETLLDANTGGEPVEGIGLNIVFAMSLLAPLVKEGVYTVEAEILETGETRSVSFRAALATPTDPSPQGG
jgi:hypothetical protein